MIYPGHEVECCHYFLLLVTGEATVPVADCNQVQFESHPKHPMLFKDFIKYWEEKNNAGSAGSTDGA